MMGLERKLKRRKMFAMKKEFMKEFKKKMNEFKKQVKCSQCNYYPIQGENIDDWHIDKNSENINLICTTCLEEGVLTTNETI